MKKINKKKILFVSITFLIALCLLFYFIFSYYSTPIQPRTIHKKHTSYPTVSFVAVGDNIIHENVYQYALKQGNDTTYNFKPCYQHVKNYISSHDLAEINQETLIDLHDLHSVLWLLYSYNAQYVVDLQKQFHNYKHLKYFLIVLL